MTKQKMTNLIGAGTLATIMLIIFLAFGSFNNGVALGEGGGDNIFTTLASNFGEGEDEAEDEGDEMEEGEMGEENEMEDEDEDEEDDD